MLAGKQALGPPVNTIDSNKLQKDIQDLDFHASKAWTEEFPPVFISYATGTRKGIDADGAGPGMALCHKIVMALDEAKIPCWTGLHSPAGSSWKEYFTKLEQGRCVVMIVIRTKAYYDSNNCMKELAKAFQLVPKGIIPLRCEAGIGAGNEPLVEKGTEWPQADAGDDKADHENYKKLAQKLGGLNSSPSRGICNLSDAKSEDMGSLQSIVAMVKAITDPLQAMAENDQAWKLLQDDTEVTKFMAQKQNQFALAKQLSDGGDETKFVVHHLEIEGFKARREGRKKQKAGISYLEQRKLNKKLYFASGRNCMPWREGEIGFGAGWPDVGHVLDLLEKGADPDGYGEGGNRALHWAIFKRCEDTCYALIGAEADPNKLGFMANSGLMLKGNVS